MEILLYGPWYVGESWVWTICTTGKSHHYRSMTMPCSHSLEQECHKIQPGCLVEQRIDLPEWEEMRTQIVEQWEWFERELIRPEVN